MSIQGSINSMIGSASHAIMAVRGYQALKGKQAAAAEKAKAQQAKKEVPAQSTPSTASPQMQAAQVAKQSAANAIEAKKAQRLDFAEYRKKVEAKVRERLDALAAGGTNGEHK